MGSQVCGVQRVWVQGRHMSRTAEAGALATTPRSPRRSRPVQPRAARGGTRTLKADERASNHQLGTPATPLRFSSSSLDAVGRQCGKLQGVDGKEGEPRRKELNAKDG